MTVVYCSLHLDCDVIKNRHKLSVSHNHLFVFVVLFGRKIGMTSSLNLSTTHLHVYQRKGGGIFYESVAYGTSKKAPTVESHFIPLALLFVGKKKMLSIDKN